MARDDYDPEAWKAWKPMDDADHRLFSISNTAALLVFTENGNPPTLSFSQNVLAEHGMNVLKAYREMVVAPTIEKALKDGGAEAAIKAGYNRALDDCITILRKWFWGKNKEGRACADEMRQLQK